MLIEHFLIARDSSIDQEKNTLSVFDLIEEVQIRSPGGEAPFGAQILGVIRRTTEKGDVNSRAALRITAPDGKILFNQILPVTMKPEHRRMRLRVNIPFPVHVSGDYVFSLALDDSMRAEQIVGIRLEKVPVN